MAALGFLSLLTGWSGPTVIRWVQRALRPGHQHAHLPTFLVSGILRTGLVIGGLLALTIYAWDRRDGQKGLGGRPTADTATPGPASVPNNDPRIWLQRSLGMLASDSPEELPDDYSAGVRESASARSRIVWIKRRDGQVPSPIICTVVRADGRAASSEVKHLLDPRELHFLYPSEFDDAPPADGQEHVAHLKIARYSAESRGWRAAEEVAQVSLRIPRFGWELSHARFGPGVLLKVRSDHTHVALSAFRCEVTHLDDPGARVAVADEALQQSSAPDPSNEHDYLYPGNFDYVGGGGKPPWPPSFGMYLVRWWAHDFSRDLPEAGEPIYLGEYRFTVTTGGRIEASGTTAAVESTPPAPLESVEPSAGHDRSQRKRAVAFISLVTLIVFGVASVWVIVARPGQGSGSCSGMTVEAPLGSLSPRGSFSYEPKNTCDGSLNTAWCAPLRAYGPQVLVYTFKPAIRIGRITIANGYSKVPKLFGQDARARTLELRSGSGVTQTLELRDQGQPQGLDAWLGVTDSLRLTISRIYPGQSDVVCLTEVHFVTA